MKNPKQSSPPLLCLLQQLIPGLGFPRFWSASWNFHENAGNLCGFPVFPPHFMDSPIHPMEEQPPLLADGELWQKEVVALSSTHFSWNFFPFFFSRKQEFWLCPQERLHSWYSFVCPADGWVKE